MYDQEMKLMAYYEFKRIENAIQTYQSSKQTNGDKIGAECKKKTQEEVDDDGLSSAGSDRAQQMEESGADAAEEVKPKEEQKEETSKTIEQGDIGGREADGDGEVVGKEEEVEEEKRNEIDISQLTDDAVSEGRLTLIYSSLNLLSKPPSSFMFGGSFLFVGDVLSVCYCAALVLIDSWGPFVDALKETGQEVEKMINSALDDEGECSLYPFNNHEQYLGSVRVSSYSVCSSLSSINL